MTGDPEASARFQQARQANLFLIADDRMPGWWRYHKMFRGVLRRQLEKQQPTWCQELHERASIWFEANGHSAEAVAHGIHARDWLRVARLLEPIAQEIIGRGEHEAPRSWLESLPTEILTGSPELLLDHAWTLFLSGERNAGQRLLDQVTGLWPAPSAHPRFAETLVLQAQITFPRDLDRCLANCRRALVELPPELLAQRCVAMLTLGGVHRNQGAIEAAQEVLGQCIADGVAGGCPYPVLMARILLAEIELGRARIDRAERLLREVEKQREIPLGRRSCRVDVLLAGIDHERNRLAESHVRYDRAMKEARATAQFDLLSMASRGLSEILYAQGKNDEALEAVDLALAEVRRCGSRALEVWLIGCRASLQLSLGKLPEVQRWLADEELAREGRRYCPSLDGKTRARALLATGRADEALAVIASLLAAPEVAQYPTSVIELSIVQALALHLSRPGCQESAFLALERALLIAEPGGFVRIFADYGLPMLDLLLGFQLERPDSAVAQDYLELLIDACEESKTLSAVAPISSPLTDRETSVLRLMAAGLTNPQIASSLSVALSTIKTHVANLLKKLDVQNRTQAVTRAREKGLLR